jgi:hypothetical protein
MATVMFIGMSFCLPLAYVEEWLAKNKKRAAVDVLEPLVPVAVRMVAVSPSTRGHLGTRRQPRAFLVERFS